jgi:serine/threonine-protein kinase
VLAYELLAGAHPFADRTTRQELLSAQLSETPTLLSRCAPELPPTLNAFVMRCLEKIPARRPQSAREILDALAVVATPPVGRGIPRWRGRGRAPRVLMAIAGLLALALTGYVAIVRRDEQANGRAPAGPPSLAVLPFEDLSGDTANAYFGDGIADEIATALSKTGGLRVASRTSAAAYRSSHNVDVRELGRQLAVSTVLEGRVRRAGDRMRLTVQLTSVADGLALWSNTYERHVKDVFEVQDEIARSIVNELRAKLPGFAGPYPVRVVSSPGTTSLEAYDLYLRGSYLLELDRRASGVAKAVKYFERAIAADSTYARAYAGLGYALELTPVFSGTPPHASSAARSTSLVARSRSIPCLHRPTPRWRWHTSTPCAGKNRERHSSAPSRRTLTTRRANTTMETT